MPNHGSELVKELKACVIYATMWEQNRVGVGKRGSCPRGRPKQMVNGSHRKVKQVRDLKHDEERILRNSHVWLWGP